MDTLVRLLKKKKDIYYLSKRRARGRTKAVAKMKR
jgi:hypothetical protein